jgi:nicotinamide mononucleotide adenylyltransferase
MTENTAVATPTPEAAPKKEKKPRIIQKTILAWFMTMNDDQLKAITVPEFVAKVVEVCPEWQFKDDEVKSKGHLAWYRSHYKKLMKDPKVEAAPATEAVA